MKTIYKYQLQIKDVQLLELPTNYRILSVKEQNGDLYLWAIVDTDAEGKTSIQIEIFGTGNPIDAPDRFLFDEDDYVYLNTVVMSNGLVWHVFKNDAPF